MVFFHTSQINFDPLSADCIELFLEQKARRGKKADTLTFEKFHEDWEHLKFQPPLCNQAMLFSPY
jgi:hypothetical protein